MIFVLEAYNTDSRYPSDIRYRDYTTSKRRAEAFEQIPKIQFSDSGHGICFSAQPHQGPRLPKRRELDSYVQEHLVKAYIKDANTFEKARQKRKTTKVGGVKKAFAEGVRWAMEDCQEHRDLEMPPMIRGMCPDCWKKGGT